MTRRKRIAPVGARKERLAEWHAWCYQQVRERCDARLDPLTLLRDRCEACGVRPWRDWAHLFGRGNVVAEPWCSLPELTMGLCRECHDVIDQDRDPELRERLRRMALIRLGRRFPVQLPLLAHGLMPADVSAVDFARECERLLVAAATVDALPDFAPRPRSLP